MTSTPSDPFARSTFLAPYEAAGYRPVEPPVLQPADVMLDLLGEDLGRRLYLTTDRDGRELCLRPEMTVPVCLDHIAGGPAARTSAYCYHGPVFRQRPNGGGEFVQAGAESIGRADVARADAEILMLAWQTARRAGIARPRVRAGDTGVFRTLLAALELDPAWRRRIARAFGRGELVATGAAGLAPPVFAGANAGVLGALAGADRDGARALVRDLLAIGGLTEVGGRSVGEIADRFLEQAETVGAGALSPATAAIIDALVATRGGPAAASDALARLAAGHGLDLSAAIEAFEARRTAIAEAGIPDADVAFDFGFGRRLDYYSGFVFEIEADPPHDQPAIGGGRYDRLLGLLGGGAPVPAVGFSVWIDRLPGARP